jgi:hypothetical protein
MCIKDEDEKLLYLLTFTLWGLGPAVVLYIRARARGVHAGRGESILSILSTRESAVIYIAN